ncbi:hypothetical protein JCM14720_02810 [Calditerricola yamamurae]
MTIERRFRLASRLAVMGVGVNVLLAVVKGLVGVWAGSRALIADAVNSATDVAGSLAVWIGLRLAHQPPFSYVRDAWVHVNPLSRKCSDFQGEDPGNGGKTAGNHVV